MIFGALRKFSTIDYPEKLACVLGTKGCNMHCHWCHNYDLISFDVSPACRVISESEILDFLKKRVGFLDGVVISGGEPTLHEDLPDVCGEIKSLGFALKLDTNGTNPDMLATLIDRQLVDYVAMDVKTDLQTYPTLTKNESHPQKIKQCIEILLNGSLAYEFRTTCVKPIIDKGKITKIGRMIKGADHLYLQKFDPSHVFNPAWVKHSERDFDEAEMAELLSIVKPFVTDCHIR